MKTKFEVGDKVRIRQWNDMVKEFGIAKNGDIEGGSFVSSMKHLCGRTATIESINSNGTFCLGDWSCKDGDLAWYFDQDMVEFVETKISVGGEVQLWTSIIQPIDVKGKVQPWISIIQPINKENIIGAYFNDKKMTTVVKWKDGTTTKVKVQTDKGDTYNPETGMAMCICKKALGNKGNFNEVFKKWLPKEYK